MRELLAEIPDADVLLALETEELAGKILLLWKARGDLMQHPASLISELSSITPGQEEYPLATAPVSHRPWFRPG